MTSVHAFRERPAAPALRSVVASVWVQRVEGDAEVAHRTVPNGAVELVCELGRMPKVVGPQTGPVVETLAPGATVVGLRLRPGAAPLALGPPASELVDLAVAAEDVLGRPWRELGVRIAAAGSASAAAELLEVGVAERLDGAAQPDGVVAEAVRRLMPWRGGDVGSLAGALSLSERQLRRRVLAATGLGPKTLQRVLRFQGFLALVQRALVHGDAAQEGLARLAAEAGYADQSHLARESARLAGSTPGALLSDARRHCAPPHDHRATFVPLLRLRALA